MKKVNILMSTYNGEKYLKEQLDSLLHQTYENIEIHVRDDGSADGTKEILKAYEQRGEIKFYEGENVGYKKSFYWLLKNCGDADYFAYCDQDDIWLPQKIEMSVEALSEYEEIPALYISDFYWSDADANPERADEAYKKEHGITRFITRGDLHCFGFTEVFNKVTYNAIKDKECTAYCVHDEIPYQYCLSNGKVLWGREPAAYYRRHGNNASPQEYVGGTKFSHFIWRLKTFLFKNNKEEIYQRAVEFYHYFKTELPVEEQRIYETYTGNKHRMKKVFWNRRYRDTLWDEFCIRILFLIGRM